MSFQQKNIAASLLTFSLILGFYVIWVLRLIATEGLTAPNLFQTWGIIALLAVLGTILVSILAHIAGGVAHKIRTNEDPRISDIQDERDQLINLKGSRVAYTCATLGVALSMLTFVLGQSPLVMFASLIFFGLLAQIIADGYRLALYRKGF